MKATGYVQLIADKTDYAGRPTSLKMARVGKRYPADPLPGAIIVKLSVDVPDELLNLQAEVLLRIEDAMVAELEQETLNA